MVNEINREDGFTLIEILFVLGILSILILITPKMNMTTIDNISEKQFFELLQSDVLYIQSLAPTTKGKNVRIRFFQDRYIVYNETETYASRNYPDDLSVDYKNLNTLQFDGSGTIIRPRTILITSKDNVYHVVFPLGKGRFHIVKD